HSSPSEPPSPATRNSENSPRKTRSKWRRRAACRSKPGLDWHSNEPDMVQTCLAICRTCPTRAPCLFTAVLLRDPWGIWGGVTAGRTRSSYRRKPPTHSPASWP
ncbi:WhiB family transcriptional regulator, partial [Amycolatopsis azurea]